MLAVVVGLTVTTVLCKGLGPALDRLPVAVTRATKRLAPALLAALIASQVVSLLRAL